MGLISLIREHWSAAALLVITPISAKVVDKYFDLGWFAKLGNLFVEACVAIWALLVAPMPVWLLLLVLLLVAFVSMLTRADSAPNAPAAPYLSPSQIQVLHVISRQLERNIPPSGSELMQLTGYSRLVTEGAIDVLQAKGLICWAHGNYGAEGFGLTARGRAYLLSPDLA